MDKPKEEIIRVIANFSFTIERVEEVGMSEIYTTAPYKVPNAYSVSWSEWPTKEGEKIKAEIKAQVDKERLIQRFEDAKKPITEVYEIARKFFVDKVNSVSLQYRKQ